MVTEQQHPFGQGPVASVPDAATLTRYVGLLLLSLCGCGGPSQPPPQSVPEGCVQITLDNRDGRLPGSPSTDRLPVSPFWFDSEGLHVVWYGDADGAPRLVRSSFALDGAPQSETSYGAFPEGVAAGLAGPQAAGASPAGDFAVALTAVIDESTDQGWQGVLLGNTASPDSWQLWEPPWPIEEGRVFHVAWNGETFDLAAVPQTGDSSLLVAQLAADGTLSLPLARVAAAGPIAKEWAATTDLDSGETLFAHGDRSVLLTGHRRGEPLAALGGGDYATLRAVGTRNPGAPGSFPGIARNAGEVMVSWADEPNLTGTVLQAYDAATLVPQGDALTLPARSDDDSAHEYRARALAHDGEGWSLIALAYLEPHIDWIQVKDGTLTAQVPLVTNESGTGFDARAFTSALHRDDLWFGFHDFSDDAVEPSLHPYQIVKVRDGCSYSSSRQKP